MARFYADEQYLLPVVQFLPTFDHDVLTVQEAGNAGIKIPEREVLAFTTNDNRAVLTLNRTDFIGLHRLNPNHAGIIACSNDRNFERLASRIDEAIAAEETLAGKLIRVNRPQE